MIRFAFWKDGSGCRAISLKEGRCWRRETIRQSKTAARGRGEDGSTQGLNRVKTEIKGWRWLRRGNWQKFTVPLGNEDRFENLGMDKRLPTLWFLTQASWKCMCQWPGYAHTTGTEVWKGLLPALISVALFWHVHTFNTLHLLALTREPWWCNSETYWLLGGNGIFQCCWQTGREWEISSVGVWNNNWNSSLYQECLKCCLIRIIQNISIFNLGQELFSCSSA